MLSISLITIILLVSQSQCKFHGNWFGSSNSGFHGLSSWIWRTHSDRFSYNSGYYTTWSKWFRVTDGHKQCHLVRYKRCIAEADIFEFSYSARQKRSGRRQSDQPCPVVYIAELEKCAQLPSSANKQQDQKDKSLPLSIRIFIQLRFAESNGGWRMSYIKRWYNRFLQNLFIYERSHYDDWTNSSKCSSSSDQCFLINKATCKQRRDMFSYFSNELPLFGHHDGWLRKLFDPLYGFWNRHKTSKSCSYQSIIEYCNESPNHKGTCAESSWQEKSKRNDVLSELNDYCVGKSDFERVIETSQRIVGGIPSNAHDWPWHVSVFPHSKTNKRSKCGGTLIHKEWVITAAHCLKILEDDLSGEKFEIFDSTNKIEVKSLRKGIPIRIPEDEWNVYVRVGDHDLRVDEAYQKNYAISHIVIHPMYLQWSSIPYFDLALLKLSKPIVENNAVRPICLLESSLVPQQPTKDKTLVSNCVAVGWGSTTQMDVDNQFIILPIEYTNAIDEEAMEFPDNLQQVPINIHESLAPCKQDLMAPNLMRHAHICAGEHGMDTCHGDSGGGLYCQNSTNQQWFLMGVTSFGAGCGTTNSVYANVLMNFDWIKEIIEYF